MNTNSETKKTSIYVISDLHLGGDEGGDGKPSFQMCPHANQELLIKFIQSLPTPNTEKDIHLVIAGDIVDFLAEREFEAITSDQEIAFEKFKTIIDRTAGFWEALKQIVQEGNALTLMLGNHDIELSYPDLRKHLIKLLGVGRIDFLYDNQAFVHGPVLIEHGNRHDSWNAVPHGALRRLRSQLSRKIKPTVFDPMPGSQLVVEVINELKAEYSFVDLLKPETAGVLPILAALGAGDLSRIWKAWKQFRRKYAVDYDENYEPIDETYIAAVPDKDQKLYELAQHIDAGGDATQIGAFTLSGLRELVGEPIRNLRRKGLKKAFEVLKESHRNAFDIEYEDEKYITPAKKALSEKFDVVVFGHTHLVKKKFFENNKMYINSGTWADVMRVPLAAWDENEEIAAKVLDNFVHDLEKDNVKHWRKNVSTYTKIDVTNTHATAEVFFADNNEILTNEGLARRFERKEK